MRRLIAYALLALVFVTPARAMDVKRVTSPGGIEIWLVEDHRLPVTALAFAFRGGMSVDPAGKAGLAHFTSGVLDEGAGTRNSEQFQAALSDNAIGLGFSAGRDSFNGTMRFLTVHQDLAAELLHDALTNPHLDPGDVDRIRDQVETEIKRNMANPEWVAQRNFNQAVFNGHPYGQPGYGTLESVAGIAPDDLRGYIKAHFGRDQLLLTMTGDLDAKAAGLLADRIFGDLPAMSAKIDVADAVPGQAGQVFVVDKPVPESVLLMGAPGPKRDDRDWYAAEIMNYILGGGGFSARLMEDVRVKHALTYGIDSSLVPYEHAGLMLISATTKNEDAGKALDLVKADLAAMQAKGASDDEISGARTYLTGALPLELTSTLNVSRVLLTMRLERLPIDFLDTVTAKLNAVTSADVGRVSKRFLAPSHFATVALGKPEGVKATAAVPQ